MTGLVPALLARCPICGGKKIWKSYGQTKERCPTCGHRYEYEEGYWVGAMAINIGIAITVFFVLFVGGIALTWPDVAWTPLLVITLVVMGFGPWLWYRPSKTIWVWMDTRVLPYEGKRRAS